MRLVAAVTMVGLWAQPSLSFQEGTAGGGADKPAAVAPVDPPKAPADARKGLNLKVPELSLGQGTGTEVKIPGLGTVGVLPRLDFGLELLYGATESRGRPDEKSEPSDVQIRGTIKHRF